MRTQRSGDTGHKVSEPRKESTKGTIFLAIASVQRVANGGKKSGNKQKSVTRQMWKND